MLQNANFQQIIKGYDDVPIYYGGTDLTTPSEEIEWVSSTYSLMFHNLLGAGIDIDIFISKRSNIDWSRKGYLRFSEVLNLIKNRRPDYYIYPKQEKYPAKELKLAQEYFIGHLNEEYSLIYMSPKSLA